MKTPIVKMGNFFEQLGLSSSAISNPVEKIGGIWVLWNPIMVSMRSFQVTHQVVHVVVERNKYKEWLISVVYASPKLVLCKHLWDNLVAVGSSSDFPWLVARDFNDFMDNIEIRSLRDNASSNNYRRAAIFSNCG